MGRIDVAVVGGGPAGASAAERAAAAGAETVLLEQGVPREDRDRPGPDSTDAAGMLDYWVDIMGVDVGDLPDGVVLRELSGARFVGPSTAVSLETTGMEASYPGFGFTFHRARMDDWLHERARSAGADIRVGVAVRSLETTVEAGVPVHTLSLADGGTIEADAVVLADGPQRRVTMGALQQFVPAGTLTDALSPPTANHIAYQEYRRFPEGSIDTDTLTFWWGHMPGETAYPWIFPNDGRVARVGLTMPIGLTLEEVTDPAAYPLLEPTDDRLPNGGEYIRRLLEREFGDDYDVPSDFPLVEDRGKSAGTETYPISSTRPIDSPVGANVAVAGGAMGTTSAFHEGGYHVAARSGAIAGRLAATGELDRYNDAWKRAIGDEIRRNVVFADIVEDFGPADWDRAFTIARRMKGNGSSGLVSRRYTAGLGALRVLLEYKYRKFRTRGGRYVQVHEEDYRYDW